MSTTHMSKTTPDTATLDQTLNDMVLSGKALEAFDRFYADDVVMQENSAEPRVGKDVNRKFEEEFFSSLKEFHEGKVLASAVNGDTSFSEWFMDVTFRNGQRYKMAQVAVRK